MHPVGQPVEQRSGKALAAKDLHPIFEGQVGGDNEALPFVGAADDIEQKLGARFGKGDISEFVQDEDVLALQLRQEALKLPVFPLFQEFGHQLHYGIEASLLALGAGGEAEGCCQVGLAGAAVAKEEDVLLFVDVFAAQRCPWS